jgi:hypothetical protein
MEFDPQRVLVNVRKATTDDLLDRVTAYREEMEPEALAIIEDELRARGVGPEQIEAHRAQCARQAVFLPDGVAARCSFCHQPAVEQKWAWHRLWDWGGPRQLVWRAVLALVCLAVLTVGYLQGRVGALALVVLGTLALWGSLGAPVFPRKFSYCKEHRR